jgi:hypothetical protein
MLARFFTAVQFTLVRSSAAQSDDPGAILNEAAAAYNAASRELEKMKIREQHDDLVDSVTRTPFLLILTPDKPRAAPRFRCVMAKSTGTIRLKATSTPRPQAHPTPASCSTPQFLTAALLSAKFLRQESLQAGGAQHFGDVIEAHYERTHQSRNVETSRTGSITPRT